MKRFLFENTTFSLEEFSVQRHNERAPGAGAVCNGTLAVASILAKYLANFCNILEFERKVRITIKILTVMLNYHLGSTMNS
jgi:20S proteasome alpha/beta subunit